MACELTLSSSTKFLFVPILLEHYPACNLCFLLLNAQLNGQCSI